MRKQNYLTLSQQSVFLLNSFLEKAEMSDFGEKATKQLGEITECPICMSAFSDPRMLPCIHSFCFECLKRTAEAAEKKPGDRMPCPLCRKDFFIPADGVNGLQKNFFMENLLEFKTTLQIESAIIICDMCNVRNEGKTGDIPKATMRCLECQDNYCDSCVKVHQFQKLSKIHQLVQIGSEAVSEMKRRFSTKHCSKHTHKPLDYYCADCKKIVCVSCFVESHKLHDCKDVTTVGEEFRQTIKQKAENISTYVKETLLLRNNNEKSKADFLKEIVEQEQKIHERNQELKDTIDRDVIDRHTNSLLDELSMIKRKHLKEMETGMEEIYRHITILKSFESYCTEMISKGSASDICSSVDQLIVRADELGKEHEALIGRPRQSAGIYFQATDLGDVLQNTDSNCVGKIEGNVIT